MSPSTSKPIRRWPARAYRVYGWEMPYADVGDDEGGEE